MRERSLGFDLSLLGFWLIIAFCFLRSVEVLFIRGSLPYVQYFIALAGFLYFIVSFLEGRKKSLSEFRVGYPFLFPVAVLVAVILQVFSFDDVFDEFGRSSHKYVFQTTFVILAWFFAGALVARGSKVEVGVKWPVYWMFALLVLMVLFATDFGFSIPYTDLEESGAFEVMNHLLLSEYMLLVCYAAYVFSMEKIRPVIFFIVAYVMFSGGGRASFIIGLLSILFFEFFFGSRRILFHILLAAISVSIFISLKSDFSDSLFQYMLFSDGVDKDNSYVGRVSQFEAGMQNLGNQFLFGDVSFFAKRFNSLGSYIHNFLSVWQFYGFFFFVFWLWMVFVATKKLIKASCQSNLLLMDKFFLLVFVYSIISVLFVKHVGFGSFWYALGYWILQTRVRPKS